VDKLIKALQEAYRLDVIHIDRIDFGLWEESFAVRTESGKYYAKRFWRKERIDTRYHEMLHGLILSQELRKNGFPAPKIIVSLDNMPITKIEGDYYLVTEWIDGKTFHPGELPHPGAFEMGCLLGKFHSHFPSEKKYEYLQVSHPTESYARCEKMMQLLIPHHGVFVDRAKEILAEQMNILAALPSDLTEELNLISRLGTVYGSYWVEQVMFNEANEIIALIDWTDGAGRKGSLLGDLDTAVHISAFGKEMIFDFFKGYHREYRLSEEEWLAVVNMICFGHLGDVWIYDSWLRQTNRRMEHWEKTAIRWLEQIPRRYYDWNDMKEFIVE
jgi:Ser/Thr protein kinase RdoA (MazF antagonist)